MTTVYVGSEMSDFAPLQRQVEIVDSEIRRPTLGTPPIGSKVEVLRIPTCLSDPRAEFAALAKKFTDWLENDDLRVVVSQVKPLDLNPLLGKGPENLIAMLILAFPEVRWIFGTIRGYGERDPKIVELDAFRDEHGLQNLFQTEQSSLFDGMGIRDWVRQRIAEHQGTKSEGKYLARRTQSALALDEESDYASLHAYTAYRFGYRASSVTSFSLATFLLSGPKLWQVVLEDIYTNFPDGKPGVSKLYHDSNSPQFKGRATEWPQLAKANHRILITSGFHNNPERWKKNYNYLLAEQASGKHIEILYKPYAGVFRLWDGAGLTHKLKWQDRDGTVHRGVAEGYIWPAKDIHSVVSDDLQSGHSAPGILLAIAQHLLHRAEALVSDVSCVKDAVVGAVLATDALELLGGRTPTLAVQALRLKHHFEVLAECRFSGMEHHFLIKERLMEIRRDVQAIGKWFGQGQQESAKLNIEMHVLDALVEVFQDNSQFDEEHSCRHRMLHLHNTLWMQHGSGRLLAWPFLRYVELLLSSFRVFAVAIASWVLFFSVLFVLAKTTTVSGSPAADPNAFERAYSFFFGGAVPAGPGFLESLVTLVATVTGLGHLGIFFAHLYNLVSRK